MEWLTDMFGMKQLVQLGILAGSGFVIYWFLWRPVTQRKESYHEFFQALEDVNATPFFKFRMLFKGLKTELWANFLIIAPIIAMLLEWTEMIPPLINLPFLPDWAQPGSPGLLTAIGFVTRYLNSIRSTPPGSPVPEKPTPIEVPTVAGTPDVVVVASASGGVQDIIPKGQVIDQVTRDEWSKVPVEDLEVLTKKAKAKRKRKAPAKKKTKPKPKPKTKRKPIKRKAVRGRRPPARRKR